MVARYFENFFLLIVPTYNLTKHKRCQVIQTGNLIPETFPINETLTAKP